LFKSRCNASVQRDVDCNSGTARIPAIEQIIAVVYIVHVYVVGLVPILSPVFRIRVHGAEPIPVVLKARISTYGQEWQAIDMEEMPPAKVGVEVVVRDAIAVVPAPLLPAAMF
jgi:hypothetical protein